MAVAAAAAAERRRQRNLEEEQMTTYRKDELEQGWEFKILRSATAQFKQPEVLKAVLTEEAGAGWELLEKFDNERLRFKRPVAARKQDANLALDPYRTQYGFSEGKLVAYWIIGVIIVLAAFIAVMFWINP